MDSWISRHEYEALQGLPHIQQLLYLKALRPYMDYQTNIVGIRRGVSYRSIAEELYVEPKPGVLGVLPSRDQIKRALQGLSRAGVIRLESIDKKLIIKCIFSKRDESVQKKAALLPPQEAALEENVQHIEMYKEKVVKDPKAALGKPSIPALPHNNNYYFFLLKKFEDFWEIYPLKKSKGKAWKVFQSMEPDEMLCEEIISSLDEQVSFFVKQKQQGKWMPNWKYPANWLEQSCWLDEVTSETIGGDESNAASSKNYEEKSDTDLFWESCKPKEKVEDNVIAFKRKEG